MNEQMMEHLWFCVWVLKHQADRRHSAVPSTIYYSRPLSAHMGLMHVESASEAVTNLVLFIFFAFTLSFVTRTDRILLFIYSRVKQVH